MIMTSRGILSIHEVNSLPDENFEWLFHNVIEYSPEAATAAVNKKPFSSTEDLKKAFDDYLDKLDMSEKEIILLHHPDLSSKYSEVMLTAESRNEQKLAGLDTINQCDKESFINNLSLYKEKFGFPFVICARENNLKSIMDQLCQRLHNCKETELKAGIEEVKKICRIRIDDLVWPDV
ncbi:2-oxo-4-hydroxy-4-carboxy-5-ureidoimidazoline decarboxylase-like isoform X2 [Trichogramma pretiosum]|uniref:2-oxo-4-hydroxy-4-carboxy-5-ureidoimidazoline decarboxylase-like isoform X1 n=2 Tax=Trichogramma pretiosum TaxID=7493 RepID=UPI0006C93BDC|nr:2-oxo-4-hydroxy-4-carboxy-5-ureidoimidazoline decarboxylase-like isoform X1 [Trichogramma pretiosum]XP_014224605.1 2-oxo-4-hydroxy-4-carboxy-5-ureidoimidazoline decarboxylase-like isoform X2 [Trichogramma pretiosum]